MRGITSPRLNPEVILANPKTLQDNFHDVYAITCHFLSHLTWNTIDVSNLAHSPRCAPNTSLRRLCFACCALPPKETRLHRTNLISHTDLGAMTNLFNLVGGVQYLSTGSENVERNWVYIRSELGCAVINLGDAIVQWSGRTLRSNIPYVATTPGQRASYPRFSLAYLLRPEAKASMRRLEGGDITPRVSDGEQENSLCVRDWGRTRTAHVIVGKSLPRIITSTISV